MLLLQYFLSFLFSSSRHMFNIYFNDINIIINNNNDFDWCLFCGIVGEDVEPREPKDEERDDDGDEGGAGGGESCFEE